MEPTIIKLDEFYVVGLQTYGNGTQGQLLKIWDVFQENCLKIPNKANRKYHYGIQSFTKEMDEKREWFYLVGAEVKDFTKIPVQMCGKLIPKNKYAVFEYKGPVSGFGKLYHQIYTEYLPSLGLQSAAPYDFERYDKRFISPQSEESIIEIFIPVKNRKKS